MLVTSTGPRRAGPTPANAAVLVATPSMGRTVVGNSSTYTPGCINKGAVGVFHRNDPADARGRQIIEPSSGTEQVVSVENSYGPLVLALFTLASIAQNPPGATTPPSAAVISPDARRSAWASE